MLVTGHPSLFGILVSHLQLTLSAVQNIVEGQDWSTFGIDEDGPVAESTCDNLVEVPEVSVPLTIRQLQELRENISPLVDDGNHGCNLYTETVQNFLQFQ